MARTFKDAVKNRRSYYLLSNESSVSDVEIEEIIRFASEYVPSAFNSQSTRLVLLLGGNHLKFWDIVRETLRAIVPPESFTATDQKITSSFASGYGTVLFFEEETVVEKLQEKFPLYRASFPAWSQHTSAMHQFTVWTMLTDIGFGASLQHYNPIIDQEVRKTWGLPDSWTLVAQMPFGLPLADPDKKAIDASGDRVRTFKD